MGFASKHLGTGKTEVREPSPRRDGLGAALRTALGGVGDTLPEEFTTRLAKIDAATGQPRPRRDRA
jgi:hypothetical protein